MKIALAQFNFIIGDLAYNSQKIIKAITEAREAGAEIICFPELALTGYPCKDLLIYPDFIENIEQFIAKIAKTCLDITAIVGAPSKNTAAFGKKLHNSAYLLAEGKVIAVVNKTLLPTYDVFDENRYFEPDYYQKVVKVSGKTIAITICEDLWDADAHMRYAANPVLDLQNFNPDVWFNLSASPFSINKHNERLQMLNRHYKTLTAPLIYVNHLGAQTELLFDGRSMVWNAKGKCCKLLPAFEEKLQLIDTRNLSSVSCSETMDANDLILKALTLGIKDYCSKLGFKKVLVGLSGGIDSAVVATIAVKALGKNNVLAVILPSKYSSSHSQTDAEALAKNLKIKTLTLPIHGVHSAIENTLEAPFANTKSGIAEENVQSRARALLLMAVSNKFGYLVLNTSNKSELATGYGTLYGDMCGGLSVLGDLYKTQVYALAKHINKPEQIIPEHIITKPPSAELRPNQKDTDSLPDYNQLDSILKLYIEDELSVTEILNKGIDKQLASHIIRMVNKNEHKRQQAPPILRVSKKAFGPGRRYPIAGRY